MLHIACVGALICQHVAPHLTILADQRVSSAVACLREVPQVAVHMCHLGAITNVCVQDVNNRIKQVHEQRGLPVLSFAEGIPTTINNMLPKLTVSPLYRCVCSYV